MRTRHKSAAAVAVFTTLAVLVTLAGCGAPARKGRYSGTVKVSGSTTVLPLSQEAATGFMALNPRANVEVQGGGSSVGVAQLMQKVVDVGNSSRELKGDENDGTLVDHRIAFDIIVIVVNPANPVDELSRDQVKAIFTGKVDNWKTVGGPDKEIVCVVRDQASGTREVFDEKALGSTKEHPVESTPSAIECASNGVVREIVGTTRNAIGYISFGYVNNKVKAVTYGGVEASVADASTGRYPMARYLHMFTRGEPEGAVKGYIDFVLSDAFQAQVVSQEYIKIKDVTVK
ncbi:MAG: phosphate ABC transporter substrate-binding protein [Actinomycetota bacterium]